MMLTLPETNARHLRCARLKRLALACVLALAATLLVREVVQAEPAEASSDPFVVWCHSDPATLDWCEWIIFMQDPDNAAWFHWVTAPRPVWTVWDDLRLCEAPDWAGGWAANTGNGFYGGLQFTLSSWRGVGGTGYPHLRSRETQIEMGERLLAVQGWGAWPTCSRKLGLR